MIVIKDYFKELTGAEFPLSAFVNMAHDDFQTVTLPNLLLKVGISEDKVQDMALDILCMG